MNHAMICSRLDTYRPTQLRRNTECVTKSMFHLLKIWFLRECMQVIGVQETPCVRMITKMKVA